MQYRIQLRKSGGKRYTIPITDNLANRTKQLALDERKSWYLVIEEALEAHLMNKERPANVVDGIVVEERSEEE